MTNVLSKIIINKSKAKSKYIKWPSWENVLNLNKIKNSNSINKKGKKQYFKNVTKGEIMNNMKVW